MCETGTRLSGDWQPTEADISFCRSKRPDLNPQDAADEFRDYWIAVPGKLGRKLDWSATWRNFIRSRRATPRPIIREVVQSARDKFLNRMKEVDDVLRQREFFTGPEEFRLR